jgi:hypothetical protein
MRAAIAALAVLGVTVPFAAPALADAVRDAGNRFILGGADGFRFDPPKTEGNFTIFTAASDNADCIVSINDTPENASASADGFRNGLRQPIPDRNWDIYARNTGFFRDAPLQKGMPTIEQVGDWPVQMLTGTYEGNPVIIAFHGRPGAQAVAVCAAYETGTAIEASMRSFATAITSPRDAEWAPVIAPAADTPTVNAPSSR